MGFKQIEHDGLSFYVDDSLFGYDNWNHWLELVAWSIRKVSNVLEQAMESEYQQWVVFHRKYNHSNKLDFNYAKFASSKASFEVVRELSSSGYSEPQIINITEQA